jgi:3-phenylpropionate/cinnamic acid dioxygenase small subunit
MHDTQPLYSNNFDEGVTMTPIASDLQLSGLANRVAPSNTEAREPLRIPDHLLVDSELRAEVEQFLFFEATLLDDRCYEEWLLLLADDIHYWMPNRSNRSEREMDRESTTPREFGIFDENKRAMVARVGQLLTGRHWAEEPPSRTRHLVTNIRIAQTATIGEYSVRSNFFVYRNRLEHTVDLWVGERQDVLRRLKPLTWEICRRKITLDQNVVLSGNLSVFF